MDKINDKITANAFANSWNNLPLGSVYTKDQFEDWMRPLEKKDIIGKDVLELGCGNASLMAHLCEWQPKFLEGVDLGDSVETAKKNMAKTACNSWRVTKADLTKFESNDFDVVYCIGVLHHLKSPKAGLDAVIKNVKSGGRFHVWVYAKEGNFIVRYIVDPIRRISSHLPWWLTKYFIATPLVFPFFIYAKILKILPKIKLLKMLPLYEYSLWIAKRDFSFFRHVAFDQLVTPQTAYISRPTIEGWLQEYNEIEKDSIYIIMRNGNSWKFGGKIK